MNPPPAGWPRISSALYYRDAAKMIDWICDAFDFEVRLKVEGAEGQILHSELCYAEGLIMVGQQRDAAASLHDVNLFSPMDVGANTQNLMIYVDDVMAHCERARAAGATITQEPAVHDYGEDHWADRSYGARDPEGHVWWFTQRLRSPKS